MAKVIKYAPELEGDEQLYVAQLMKNMTEEQAEQFARVYRERRKDPQLILFTDLLGFIGVSGIHRFLLDQMFLGLIYLMTVGFCGVGTILDVFQHKKLTTRYNKNRADDVAMLIKQVIDITEKDPKLLDE